jgi:hypothetical protein
MTAKICEPKTEYYKPYGLRKMIEAEQAETEAQEDMHYRPARYHPKHNVMAQEMIRGDRCMAHDWAMPERMEEKAWDALLKFESGYFEAAIRMDAARLLRLVA